MPDIRINIADIDDQMAVARESLRELIEPTLRRRRRPSLDGTLKRHLNVLDKQLVVQRLSENAHRTGADRAQFLSSTWVSRDEKDRGCIAPLD